MKQTTKSNILTQLTLAALSLPGLVPDAMAGRVEETYNADAQYGHYSESGKRISVDVFEAAVSVPLGQAMTASVSFVNDTITGASPMYNKKDASGQIVQVLSGASKCGSSICEERQAVNAGITYFFDTVSVNVGGGYSNENDYTSRYFNTNLSMDFNKKLTTLNFGASVAFDENQPSYLNSDCGPKCHKTSQQYLLGLTQVIDQDSLIQSNMTFAYHQGYLSDPYKQVAFYYDNVTYPDPGYAIIDNGNVVSSTVTAVVEGKNDTRPQQKFQWAWLTQYVRHFGDLNDAALHLDYRLSADTWGIVAHTTELSWHQPIADGWQVIPRFRYYSQNAADFYQPVFNGRPQDYQYYSGDYRLAGFGAISGGIKLTKEFTELKPLSSLKFQAGIEYYDHKASYQLGGSSAGSFADFNYYLVTASFNLKF
jgi:hypothetical protein